VIIPRIFHHFQSQNSPRLALHAFTCEPNEEVTAVKVLELTIAEKTKTYFVVGTMFEEPGKTTTEKGRILVFEEGPADRREYCLLASHTVPGCVFAVAALGGKIAAAINSAVSSLGLRPTRYLIP
jgi:DNA damage-binding protein 1